MFWTWMGLDQWLPKSVRAQAWQNQTLLSSDHAAPLQPSGLPTRPHHLRHQMVFSPEWQLLRASKVPLLIQPSLGTKAEVAACLSLGEGGGGG